MANRTLRAGLVFLLSAGSAAGAVPTQPNAGDRLPAPHMAPVGDAGDPEASLRAVREADPRQVATDPAYAGALLVHLDRLIPSFAGSEERSFLAALHAFRALALFTLERREEAAVAVDRVLDSRSPHAMPYFTAMGVAIMLADHERIVGILEVVARLPEAQWPLVHEIVRPEWTYSYYRELREAERDGLRVRLVEALVATGWPGDLEPDARDGFRLLAVDNRLEGENREGAARLAQEIEAPDSLLTLLVGRKYDELWPAGFDRLAALGRALEAHDRTTAAALAATPDDTGRLLERARHLRSVGREGEAYELLQPFARDVPATFAASEDGMWLVNEAAYSLMALGRPDEAVDLMARLGEQDIEQRTGLVGPMINQGALLWRAGRYSDALAHALRLERDFGRYANEYGRLWNASTAVCALSSLGRASEAAERIEAMQATADENLAALTQALLCANELDAAEAVILRRLQGDESASVIRALQDYSIGLPDGDGSALLVRRLGEVRDRPAVRAAVERVARILSLPLSRIYWGDI